jgi:hypothetical protein
MTQLLNVLVATFMLSIVSAPITGKAASIQQQEKELLTGKVIASEGSGEGVPYASIGILDEATGTISDAEGLFSLSVSPAQHSRKIRVSAIGYEARELPIADLLAKSSGGKRVEITLTAQPVSLPEVEVSAKEWKTKTLGGNVGTVTMFYYSFAINPRPVQENLGRECGVLIKSDQKTTFLKKLNYCVTSNDFDEVKFRVNVYALEDGMPGQNLLPEDIIFTLTDRKRGWKQLNLEPYNLYLNHDFLITLEWIDSKPKADYKSLTISASLPGFQTVFMKDASQAKWDKFSASGIGMNVEVEQEK